MHPSWTPHLTLHPVILDPELRLSKRELKGGNFLLARSVAIADAPAREPL